MKCRPFRGALFIFGVVSEENKHMSKLWNIAVVGATGAVGAQMIECLEERDFPVGKIKYLASSRSAGEILEFKGKAVLVEELTHDSFAGIDIALFSAGGDRSKEFCPSAARAGAVCIDNSGAWRMDPDVPLVVPEVNPHAIARYAKKGIIANPNCSTIQMVVALKPLHDYAAIKRVVVSTYQAVSGTGKKAIAELDQQVKDLLQGKPPECDVYPYQIAFNCLPQIDSFGDNGYTREEMKLVNETRKIMEADIRITASWSTRPARSWRRTSASRPPQCACRSSTAIPSRSTSKPGKRSPWRRPGNFFGTPPASSWWTIRPTGFIPWRSMPPARI